MSTIKDVAREAGVSVATVSRVINNTSNTSPEVTERVNQAIKKVNYMPNNLARALVRQRANTIGIVVNNLHDVFFHDLIKGFEVGAEQTNYNIVFCSSYGSDPKSKERYVHFLTNGVTDGIIMYGSYLTDEKIIRWLAKNNINFVLIESEVPGVPTNSLLIDNIEGAKSAVNYLASIGHKSIAFISGDPNKKDLIDRLNGYMQGMFECGLQIHNDYIQHCTSDYKTGYQRMKNLLALKERPTAVFCANDSIASFAIRAIQDTGLHVPDDISIIGFDNQTLLPDDYIGPKITTVSRPLYQLGIDSINFLTSIIEAPNHEPSKQLYKTEILIKDSTKPLT